MAEENLGQSVGAAKSEKMPPLWKMIGGGMLAFLFFYLMVIGLFSLDTPAPVVMIR